MTATFAPTWMLRQEYNPECEAHCANEFNSFKGCAQQSSEFF